jgi:hypothetical protein
VEVVVVSSLIAELFLELSLTVYIFLAGKFSSFADIRLVGEPVFLNPRFSDFPSILFSWLPTDLISFIDIIESFTEGTSLMIVLYFYF